MNDAAVLFVTVILQLTTLTSGMDAHIALQEWMVMGMDEIKVVYCHECEFYERCPYRTKENSYCTYRERSEGE